MSDGMLTLPPDGNAWQVSPFIDEYPLREWLQSARATEEEASARVRPYGLLIGRSAEIRALKRALETHRAVVLSGPGGVGKTHLALQAAVELAPRYADGVTVVHLSAMTSADLVPAALVRALGLTAASRQEPWDIALEYLATREMLVVFDMADHVPEVGTLVHDLLKVAPQVRVLVTTRDAAFVPADAVITLHGVADGSALFVQASGLPSTDAPPRGESMAAIERICRQVRGYPLAIKMLASWTSLFSPEEILERLVAHVQARRRGAGRQ